MATAKKTTDAGEVQKLSLETKEALLTGINRVLEHMAQQHVPNLGDETKLRTLAETYAWVVAPSRVS